MSKWIYSYTFGWYFKNYAQRIYLCIWQAFTRIFITNLDLSSMRMLNKKKKNSLSMKFFHLNNLKSSSLFIKNIDVQK